VAQVTMNRPAVFNAFDEAMIGELDAAFAALEADASVRVIVLAGEGKHFSAGADLQWMQRASASQPGMERGRRAQASQACWPASKPAPNPPWPACKVPRWVAAWAWPAPATSPWPLTTPASRSARPSLASCPAVIGPYVTNAVGKRQARRLALTTERIGAAEALAMGLVQKCGRPTGWTLRWTPP
jgi:methylglutaconyl-CoA hydratase